MSRPSVDVRAAGDAAVALTFMDGQALRIVFDASAEGDGAVEAR